jgi:hypothetical protein
MKLPQRELLPRILITGSSESLSTEALGEGQRVL